MVVSQPITGLQSGPRQVIIHGQGTPRVVKVVQNPAVTPTGEPDGSKTVKRVIIQRMPPRPSTPGQQTPLRPASPRVITLPQGVTLPQVSGAQGSPVVYASSANVVQNIAGKGGTPIRVIRVGAGGVTAQHAVTTSGKRVKIIPVKTVGAAAGGQPQVVSIAQPQPPAAVIGSTSSVNKPQIIKIITSQPASAPSATITATVATTGAQIQLSTPTVVVTTNPAGQSWTVAPTLLTPQRVSALLNADSPASQPMVTAVTQPVVTSVPEVISQPIASVGQNMPIVTDISASQSAALPMLDSEIKAEPGCSSSQSVPLEVSQVKVEPKVEVKEEPMEVDVKAEVKAEVPDAVAKTEIKEEMKEEVKDEVKSEVKEEPPDKAMVSHLIPFVCDF